MFQMFQSLLLSRIQKIEVPNLTSHQQHIHSQTIYRTVSLVIVQQQTTANTQTNIFQIADPFYMIFFKQNNTFHFYQNHNYDAYLKAPKLVNHDVSCLQLKLIMNKIHITNSPPTQHQPTVYSVTLQQANQILPILRSDHFTQIFIDNLHEVEPRNLKFLVQLTRLLRNDGSVLLQGQVSEQILLLLKNLNLFQGENQGQNKVFYKTKPAVKQAPKASKLSIGFQSNDNEQQIDQTQLLKQEGIELGKKKAQNCETKPRACANCSCGRKQVEKTVTKQQLIESINLGKPVSGCGKCYLGDSFRCGTCPYNGLPAFKPGDKLKLVEEGGVIVDSSSTFVSSTGKVKLEI